MKFNELKRLAKDALGLDDKSKSADMRLPERILAFSFLILLLGLIFLLGFILSMSVALLFMSLFAILMSAFAFLCFKNQKIYIISNEEFLFITIFGKKNQYKFREIIDIEAMQGSKILIFRSESVRIDSSAILSERLKELLNNELAKIIERKNFVSNDKRCKLWMKNKK